MSALALEIRDLVKQFPKQTALGGVTLEVKAGEVFALLGPNGAGKTTLIGACCGLLRKTSGTIRVFGTDLDQDRLTPRRQIGLVPQEVNFDPFFTVAESLRYQLGYYGKPNDEARISEVLDALSLTSKADTRTRALSGGMRRRLLIAKALVHKPRLLFLDEPTAGVDVELRRDLWRYVRKIQSEGTTIILTTHYLEEAEELADRAGIIAQGRLLLVEQKDALMKRFGEKRLDVTFASTLKALPEATERMGANLSKDGLKLSYSERTGQPPISEVLTSLYAAGLPISEVETRKAKLEDVLLQVLHSGQSPSTQAPARS